MLGALCLFLSAVEYLVPKPLPFMRIGLANMPLLLALNVLGAKDFFLLAALKVLGQGVIGGTFLSFVFPFSIAGTFASAAVMYAMGRMPGRRHIGFAGIGCAGAIVSNGVQLLLARHLVFGEAARYLAPPFLAAGLVAGVTLGIVCELFCRRSRWYASRARGLGNPGGLSAGVGEGFTGGSGLSGVVSPGDSADESLARAGVSGGASGEAALGDSTELGDPAGSVDPGGETIARAGGSRGKTSHRAASREARRLQRSRRWDGLFGADELFVAGLLMALVFLHDRSLPGLIAQFLFFLALVRVSGKRNNHVATAVFISGIVFFNLLIPHGRVLFALGPLPITRGSLLVGLERAIALSGLMMLSRVCVRSDLRLPGSIGSLLAESLRMLELMRAEVPALRRLGRGQAIAGIDRMMLRAEASFPGIPAGLSREKPRRRARGVLLLGALAILTAAIGLGAGIVA